MALTKSPTQTAETSVPSRRPTKVRRKYQDMAAEAFLRHTFFLHPVADQNSRKVHGKDQKNQ